jgi:hypothetical protein
VAVSVADMDRAAEGAVTADDLDEAIGLAVAVLDGAPTDAWDRKAGTLDWTCWETAEHLADDLFAYAAQLAPRTPPVDGYVPFVCEPGRPGGPASSIFADRAAGPSGLIRVLEAAGGLLVAVVRTRPASVRAFHSCGVSDPAGYAALGILETLVHTNDLAAGLGLTWNPPADICARVLARLFPDAPNGFDPWPTLLWACGRTDLPGYPRRTDWRPHPAAPA